MKAARKSNRTRRRALLPGIHVEGRHEIVDTSKIPALYAIMGSKAATDSIADDIFEPLMSLFLTKNQDDSFAVLNDLTLIEPEASRLTCKHTEAIVLRFADNQRRQEELLRTHLTCVMPARRAHSAKTFIKSAVRGAYDGLVELYADATLDVRGWLACKSLFPNGAFTKPTFQRIKKKTLGPNDQAFSSKGKSDSTPTDKPDVPGEPSSAPPESLAPILTVDQASAETRESPTHQNIDTKNKGDQLVLF